MNPINCPHPLIYTYRFPNGAKKWVQLSPQAVNYLFGAKKLKIPKKGKRFRYYKRKMYERRQKGLFLYIERVINQRLQAEIDKTLIYGIKEKEATY